MRSQPATSATLLIAALFLIPAIASAGTVTVTFPPLAGLVKMIDPEEQPACLLSAGGDPHHFTLSPRQAEGLRTSTLLVRSSRDDGGWKLFTGSAVVLDLWPDQDHAWLTPEQVEQVLPKIAEALSKATPGKAEQFRTNLQHSLGTVRETALAWQKALQPVASRGVVMQHPSWQHLFEANGVIVHAVLESDKHGHEHGPHALEEAHHTMQEHPDALLIGDIRHSNRTLEWMARQHPSDIKPIYLDALGSCDMSWEELMQSNLQKLEKR